MAENQDPKNKHDEDDVQLTPEEFTTFNGILKKLSPEEQRVFQKWQDSQHCEIMKEARRMKHDIIDRPSAFPSKNESWTDEKIRKLLDSE